MVGARLSVVLFCRNSGHTLETAIESVISQDCDIELLVLDGGSTDQSVDIIRRYERHVAFWRSFPDGSSTNAINEGVWRSTSRIVALLAGDDWYEPNSLGAVVRRFQQDPKLDVLSCGTRFVYVDENGRELDEKRFVKEEQLTYTLPNLLRNPLTCGRFIRRSKYLELGGYSTTFHSSDDLDFLIRLYFSRPKTATHPDLIYSYRAHSGSRTLGSNPKILLEIARDNVAMSEAYLSSLRLDPVDHKAVLAMHGKFAAQGVWYSLRQGRIREATSFIKRGMRQNSYWPAFVMLWTIAHTARRLFSE